jgi:DNA-binding FadR family transcriptional regulator
MPLKVSRKIYLELQKAIFRGEYRPHSPVPSERELSEKFNASRSAGREAVAYLSELGLVKTHPQSGTYVADYETEGSLELLFSIMKATEVIDAGVLASLLRIRLVIEPPYTREAALMADGDTLKGFMARAPR